MPEAWPACETLLLREDRDRLHVTLNRPQVRNALTHAMMRELEAVVDVLPRRRDLRVVIFRGAGGNFCAGGDLTFMARTPAAPPAGGDSDPTVAAYRVFGRILMALDRLPQAVVSLVEGAAAGGGFGLACSSDVVIAVKDAFFTTSETRSGFIPGQVAPAIAKRIGPGHARRLAVTAERIDARQAVALGIVHHCCDTVAEAEAVLERMLQQIHACAPEAVAAAKRLVLMVGEAPESQVLDRAAEVLVELLRGPEAQEGIAAFLQKRPPSWAR